MRAVALTVLALLSGAAQANQSWDQFVAGIAALPLPQRAEAAQRAAATFMGPEPSAPSARAIYRQQLEAQRQLMLQGVASIEREAERRAAAEMRQSISAEQIRALDRCRAIAPTGAGHWEFVHACFAGRR